MSLDKMNLATVEKMWRREVEAAATYKHLANRETDPKRRDILMRLAAQEDKPAAFGSERTAPTTGRLPAPEGGQRGPPWCPRITRPPVRLHRLQRDEDQAEPEDATQ